MYLPGEQEAMQQGDLVAAADIRIKKERELNNVLQQRDDIQQQQMDASNRGNGQATRQLDGMANSANRVKYAVLNLGYGVQDAATVFGTGGLAGAVRASANNMSGLGVLLAETKGGMAGLGAAVMSVELGIVALATGVMIAADAWAKYAESQRKAAEERAANEFGFRPARAIEEAGRGRQPEDELAAMRQLAEAKQRLRAAELARNKAQAEEDAAFNQQEAMNRAEAGVKAEQQLMFSAWSKLDEMRRRAGAGPGAIPQGVEKLRMTKEERAAYDKGALQFEAQLAKFAEERNKNETAMEQKMRDRVMAEKEVEKILQRVDELRKGPAGPRELEEQEADIEYRLNFLGRRRREIMAQSRAGMANVGVAAFESSTAYESLARSRMQQDPQTDLLQRIVRAEESATRALEAIREKLDPGRGARIAILEKID
jgi:hypothetical protein